MQGDTGGGRGDGGGGVEASRGGMPGGGGGTRGNIGREKNWRENFTFPASLWIVFCVGKQLSLNSTFPSDDLNSNTLYCI